MTCYLAIDIGASGGRHIAGWLEDGRIRTREVYRFENGAAMKIALTYVLPLTDRDFSRALWQSATECPVVFPGGVGVVPWMVPGGAQIAMATCEKMKDFDETFGLMHTIEKAAQIYTLAMSCGQGIRQTIPDDGLRAIARDFGVNLREAFLD